MTDEQKQPATDDELKRLALKAAALRARAEEIGADARKLSAEVQGICSGQRANDRQTPASS